MLATCIWNVVPIVLLEGCSFSSPMVSLGYCFTDSLLFFFFLGLQDGKSVGSLILGPDGEIIQLSLFVNSQDRSNSDTHEQGVRLSFDMKSKDNSDLFYNVFQLCRFCLQKVKSYPGWLSCSLNAQKQVYKHFHERFCTFSTQFRASM